MQDCSAALTLLALAQPKTAGCKPKLFAWQPTCCLSMQPHPLHLPQAISHVLLLDMCPGHHPWHICLQAILGSPISIGLNVQPGRVSIWAALYTGGHVVRLQSSKQCRCPQVFVPGVACQGSPTPKGGPQVGQVPTQQQSRYTLREFYALPTQRNPRFTGRGTMI